MVVKEVGGVFGFYAVLVITHMHMHCSKKLITKKAPKILEAFVFVPHLLFVILNFVPNFFNGVFYSNFSITIVGVQEFVGFM